MARFSHKLTGLMPNTKYYVRTYASNEAGIAYSSVKSFTTKDNRKGTFTDKRDGKTYKWVKIGNQVWMAENLAYLPSVSPSSPGSSTSPFYYIYDYQGTSVSEAIATINYNTYGVLYNWPAAKQSCPEGWHLPTDAEWKKLEMHLGMSLGEAGGGGWRGTDEGDKLKATNGWYSDGNGTDESGFTALPGGYRYKGSVFSRIGYGGYWWGATKYNTYSYSDGRRALSYVYSAVDRSNSSKEDAYSVRCIKD